MASVHSVSSALLSQAAPVVTAAASNANTAWMAAGFILLAVGVGIAALELFIPSGGILAVAAATSLVGSVACFFVYDTLWGFAALVFFLAGSPVAILVGLKIWTHTPLGRRVVLGGQDDVDEESGGARLAPETEPTRVGVGAPGSRAPLASLVGQVGVVLTPMRPVGFVRLGSERIEAHAESGMIDAGTKVTVIDCEGARIVVRPATE